MFFLLSNKNFLYRKKMQHFDPGRPDFAPYGFTCERWTPVPMKRADRHNEIELNLLQKGSLTYLLGGKTVVIPAIGLRFFGRRYRIRIRFHIDEPLSCGLQAMLPMFPQGLQNETKDPLRCIKAEGERQDVTGVPQERCSQTNGPGRTFPQPNDAWNGDDSFGLKTEKQLKRALRIRRSAEDV